MRRVAYLALAVAVLSSVWLGTRRAGRSKRERQGSRDKNGCSEGRDAVGLQDSQRLSGSDVALAP